MCDKTGMTASKVKSAGAPGRAPTLLLRMTERFRCDSAGHKRPELGAYVVITPRAASYTEVR
jgi:hypothetical protein